MGNAIIQAEYDKLDDIAGRFAKNAESTVDMRSRIEQSVQALRSGRWEGAGSISFFTEMERDVFPVMTRLTDTLEQAQSVTLQVKDIFQAAEEEAARPFGDKHNTNIYPVDRGIKKLSDKFRINGNEKIEDGDLFVKGYGDDSEIHPNDVTQGGLGDCYLIATMASIADQNPDLIKSAVRDNGDGTYTVTLYEKKGGFFGIGGKYEKVEIVVTPDFPKGEYYSKEAKQWISHRVNAGTGDRELWPRLIEKAYGQLISGDQDIHGIYSKLNKGGFSSDALTAISGSESVSKSPDHYTIEELAKMHKNGHAITLSSLPDYGVFTKDTYRNGNLTRGHSYWIDSIDVANGTVTIRNPWGYSNSSENKITIPYNELDDNFRKITTNSLNND